MEFSKNYGQIIIGYGLLSIGITLVMLFMQTSGIFWLILAGTTIVGGIWIIIYANVWNFLANSSRYNNCWRDLDYQKRKK